MVFRIPLFVVLFMITLVAPATALSLHGQTLVVGGGEIPLIESPEGFKTEWYLHGSFLQPVDAKPLLFLYTGPQFTSGHTQVKLLTGAFLTADGGASATASLWLNQKDFPTRHMHVFGEVDIYFPVRQHSRMQFYGLAEVFYHGHEHRGIGLEAEVFLDTDIWSVVAVGPVIQVSQYVSFFLAYDFNPHEAEPGVFVRLQLRL